MVGMSPSNYQRFENISHSYERLHPGETTVAVVGGGHAGRHQRRL